ncbi:MAG TPA: PTPA-CTERM sorting domain-containing protein [Synechococcales cyanobacterium M55_K2018_004]|nr:PTPA-CTERM sorting domain-containing protein [Synechococcales cyanobacterium M55_K2018_004]
MLNKVNLMVASAIAVATVGLGGAPALALSVTPTDDPMALFNRLLGGASGLSNITVDITGTTTGGGIKSGFGLFSDDTTFGLGSGVVLSTGAATGVLGPNNASNSTTGFGRTSQLNISFDVDNTVESLFFQYVFGSEEFFEYAQTAYNDSFELLLNGVNLALLPNDDPVTINNLATPAGPIDPTLLLANPLGSPATQLDAYTRVLTLTGVLNRNARNTLTIRISDVSDDGLDFEYDSAVFIRGGTIATVPSTGQIPTPALLPGLIGMGMAASRKRAKAVAAAEG